MSSLAYSEFHQKVSLTHSPLSNILFLKYIIISSSGKFIIFIHCAEPVKKYMYNVQTTVFAWRIVNISVYTTHLIKPNRLFWCVSSAQREENWRSKIFFTFCIFCLIYIPVKGNINSGSHQQFLIPPISCVALYFSHLGIGMSPR